MRIVFMGTPELAVPVLEQLLRGPYQVVAVYTGPDRPAGRGQVLSPSPVKVAAGGYGLAVYQPERLRPPEEVERLVGLAPDLIVVAAYGQMLPQEVLDIPPFCCVNLHSSLLPLHRGPSPVAAAILAGDEETGVTIMLMDAGMDSGPVLSQERAPIEPGDTTGTLSARLAQAGAKLLGETIPRWVSRDIDPRPQDDAAASYSRLISKDEGHLDWRLSVVELWRRVRAFQPWPGCYAGWGDKKLKVLEAVPLVPLAIWHGLAPGTVVELDDENRKAAPDAVGGMAGEAAFGVVAGDGTLGLCRVQLEGKRPLSAGDFLRGQRGLVGSVLR
ncbi:methionyl-tRNA formyltransferase [Chloroflexota bacterium]